MWLGWRVVIAVVVVVVVVGGEEGVGAVQVGMSRLTALEKGGEDGVLVADAHDGMRCDAVRTELFGGLVCKRELIGLIVYCVPIY